MLATSKFLQNENGLTVAAYTHHFVNHCIHFDDPATGVYAYTQEGLWAHEKESVVVRWKVSSDHI